MILIQQLRILFIRMLILFGQLINLISGPAGAAHCPHGQFYRVRLHQCVPMSSPLAHHFTVSHAQSREPPVDRDWYVEITHMPSETELTDMKQIDDPRGYAIDRLKAMMR
jgi:hypothetical protein